jgi:hypothetical protein
VNAQACVECAMLHARSWPASRRWGSMRTLSCSSRQVCPRMMSSYFVLPLYDVLALSLYDVLRTHCCTTDRCNTNTIQQCAYLWFLSTHALFTPADNGSPIGNDCRGPHPAAGPHGSGNGPLRDGKFTTWVKSRLLPAVSPVCHFSLLSILQIKEGGVREPGAVRWGTSGKIKIAGTLSDELVTT